MIKVFEWLTAGGRGQEGGGGAVELLDALTGDAVDGGREGRGQGGGRWVEWGDDFFWWMFGIYSVVFLSLGYIK